MIESGYVEMFGYREPIYTEIKEFRESLYEQLNLPSQYNLNVAPLLYKVISTPLGNWTSNKPFFMPDECGTIYCRPGQKYSLLLSNIWFIHIKSEDLCGFKSRLEKILFVLS